MRCLDICIYAKTMRMADIGVQQNVERCRYGKKVKDFDTI